MYFTIGLVTQTRNHEKEIRNNILSLRSQQKSFLVDEAISGIITNTGITSLTWTLARNGTNSSRLNGHGVVEGAIPTTP